MKLLHKVVKSSQGISINGTVSIDNTVVIKEKPLDYNVDSKGVSLNLDDEQKVKLTDVERNLQIKYQNKINELEKQRDDVISQAKAEALKITQEAYREADIIKIQAREQARTEGFEVGKNEATSQLESQLKAVLELLAELNSQRESIYIENENSLIDLAYDMTKKITLSEIKTDKDIIFSIVKQACKSFRNSDYVKISLAKCDVSETVVTDEKLIKRIAGNIADVEIELLSDAKTGTVILDNDKEIIDASVTTQLDFLKEVLNATKKPTQ